MDTGCFHILAVVNTASMNIEETVPFLISIFVLDVYPEVELLGHMVVLFLVILRILHTVFHSGYTNWEFPFHHLLTNACYWCSLWWYPFWEMWGDSSLWFWFVFPWWLMTLSTFSYTYWPFVYLWKNICLGPVFIVNWIFFKKITSVPYIFCILIY